ncbi:MAG TPA: hypothetical protein VJH03_04060 [Blastocatellia bacterium]|nr:hypothetical protein [Blastocatellia bacterium]
MNTQRNMNPRRSRFSPIAATLLLGIFVGLLSSSASAQTATTTQATTVDSSLQISVSGTVTDPNGTISVSGYVTVSCTRVIDTTLASPPAVLLTFDFSKVRGMSGTSLFSLKAYVTGGNQDTEMRPLQASDVIAVACPYYDSSKGILSASSWLVTATLNFDVTTGKLTSGSATVGNKPASL